MGGFVLAIPRRGPWQRSLVDRVIDLSAPRSPDGVGHVVTASGTLLVQCRFANTPESVGELLPKSDPSGRYWIVKRGHLTNAGDVRRLLCRVVEPATPLSTDADLMLAAHIAWGKGGAGRLEGEFSYAIWDECDRLCVVVRDHLGHRPVFVHDGLDGFVAASEAGQVALFPGVSLEPDLVALADFISGQCASRTRSLVSGIRRLGPATVTVVRGRTVGSSSYWEPLYTDEPAKGELEPWAEAVRAASERAVVAACRTTGTVLSELSGGVDSSAITGMVSELRNSRSIAAPVIAISLVYPGLDCDESTFIDAVVRDFPVDWRAFDGRPGAKKSVGGGAPPAAELGRYLAERGVTAVLSGEGGDELFFSDPLPLEPALWPRRHRLRYVTWSSRKSPRLLARRLRQEVLRQRVPRPMLNAYLRAKRAPSFETALSDFALSLVDQASREERDGLSRRQIFARDRLWTPPHRAIFETVEASDLRLGRETRCPFLDQHVVETVLSVPLAFHRFDGTWRSLQRAAFGPYLPVEVRERVGKAEFTAVRLQSTEVDEQALAVVKDLGLLAAGSDSLERSEEPHRPGTPATKRYRELVNATDVGRWFSALPQGGSISV